MSHNTGICHLEIHESPIAIVDLETTGLVPGADRIVEISVLRIDPGSSPQLVFDSLVNPLRRMSATEIHGITDDDVADAPTFTDIAGDVIDALSGCAVAAYNVYFDIKFLNYELAQAGITHEVPHFCLMYMRPMLGLGKRCKLEEACAEYGIPYDHGHIAAADVEASGQLLGIYLDELKKRQVRTFADFASLKSYKFTSSFDCDPLPPVTRFNLPRCDRVISRAERLEQIAAASQQRQAIGDYWESLTSIIADLEVTNEEIVHAVRERQRLGLSLGQVRMLHAKVFAAVISQFIADQEIDDREAKKLRRLYKCLLSLGWAPGQ